MKLKTNAGLKDWLNYIERKNPSQSCDNTLLSSQYPSLGLDKLSNALIITVTGTNGKGSTVSLLERLLVDQGYTVGTNTSPHLSRYNERVRIDGQPVADNELVGAFEVIEQSYGTDNPLRYSHYAFLASLVTFIKHRPQVVIFEVGVGGRLDPSNSLDADIAVITSIDLDHIELLGDTREKIALEKMGIARTGKPLIITEEAVPEAVLTKAGKQQIPLKLINRDFYIQKTYDEYTYSSGGFTLQSAASPALHPNCIAAALAVLEQLSLFSQLNHSTIRQSIQHFIVPGRKHVLQSQPYSIVVDVGHNIQAVTSFFSFVQQHVIVRPGGQIHAIYSSMKNKDISAIKTIADQWVDIWHLVPLKPFEPNRGAELSDLQPVYGSSANVFYHDNIEQAYEKTVTQLAEGDCLIIFGSFILVGEILKLYHPSQ